MSQISVICASDERFLTPMITMLSSLLKHISTNVRLDIYVISLGITSKSKKKCQSKLSRSSNKNFEIYWTDANEDFGKDLKINAYVSKAAYLRIFACDLIPKSVKKAIYLDCDLIVCKNIADLIEVDFDENIPALAVQDFCFPYISSHNAIPRWEEQKFDRSWVYCNTGVMVLNLDIWRDEKIADKIISYLENNPDTQLFDQGAINAVMQGRWKLIDPRWNVTISSIGSYSEINSQVSLHDLIIKPYIVHYTSKNKPWNIHFELDALRMIYFNKSLYKKYYNSSSNFDRNFFVGLVQNFILDVFYRIPRRLNILQ